MSAADKEQIVSSLILWLMALIFCAPPAFGLGYGVARKWRLRGTKVLLGSGAVGLLLAVFLMQILGNTGAIFAFTTLIAVFFGGRYGGQKNRRVKRRRHPGAPRIPRTAKVPEDSPAKPAPPEPTIANSDR